MRHDSTPMQSEILLLRDRNAVLQRQLENFRKEHLFKLAMRKSTTKQERHLTPGKHIMENTILSTTGSLYQKSTLLADSVTSIVGRPHKSPPTYKPFPKATQSISLNAKKTPPPQLSSLLSSKRIKSTRRDKTGRVTN